MMRKMLALITGVTIAVTVVACASSPAGNPNESPSATAEVVSLATVEVTPSATAGGVLSATVETAPSVTAEVVLTATTEASNIDTPITITVGDRTITATLNNTDVAQDFAAMLPITLPWFRNYGIEYITELSAPLTETGPFYTDVQPGDIVYYNPLDSITIIYAPTSSVPTLTKMGEITSDLSVFRDLPDNVEMRIELR